MDKPKKNTDTSEMGNIPPDQEALTLVAETYLDFWQENIRCWATDPESLEKWMAESSRHLTTDPKAT